jgi:YqcI/YcgG family
MTESCGPERPFVAVINTTLCPYARTAHVMYGSSWVEGLTFHDNLAKNIAELSHFCRIAFQARLHGFVLEALVGEKACSMTGTLEVMRSVMRGLASADESALQSLEADSIETPSWQFSFRGIELFTSVFSPCYPAWHTKHLPNKLSVVIFFQPDFSFDFCRIDRRNKAAKEAIRKRFAESGRPYDWHLIERRIEAHIYVSPLHLGDPPVMWWLDVVPKEDSADK